MRSLNVAVTAAMALGEALRQVEGFARADPHAKEGRANDVCTQTRPDMSDKKERGG